ncbi:MAG: thioredoxin [Tepidiformaceae bacterium]
MSTTTATDATFEAEVIASGLPTVVDFSTDWCPPCRRLSPIVEELSAEYAGRVRFVKVDGDTSPEVTAKYGVRGFPTLLVFDKGQVAQRIAGFRPKSDLVRQINAVVG